MKTLDAPKNLTRNVLLGMTLGVIIASIFFYFQAQIPVDVFLAVEKYIFKQDYYFMMGDNRHNSEDSRFWGFVPFNHILGEASFIWFSYNYQEDNLLKAIRWERFLKVII